MMSRGIGAQQERILSYMEVHGKANTGDLAAHIQALKHPDQVPPRPTESGRSSIRRSLRNLEKRGHATRNGYTWTPT